MGFIPALVDNMIAWYSHNIKLRLVHHDLKVQYELRHAPVYVDYIYLTQEERDQFAQIPHEFLFEQLLL